ncbi:hypothetical protein GCM10010517_20030 [Streptosporangium fragile]|uniref:SCO6045-like C-terminal domain-containing protein n=1 Tax=Streptosporangium fragile TaxID=46186 RepID=A0ABP6IBD3_9ACTN
MSGRPLPERERPEGEDRRSAAQGGRPGGGAERAGAGAGAERAGAAGGEAETGNAAREALASAQAELLASLVAGREAPPGFDRQRLRVQEYSLIAKRRRIVARHRPDLVEALGGDFAREFEAYARGRPKPPGGSHADVRDFAERLRAAGRLPEAPADREPGPAPGRWSRLFRRR